MRQFSVGEVVTWIPDLLLRYESRGDYRIVGQLPDRDGDHIYRIKSPLEEYERVVKESLLVKSQGYLPEEIQDEGSREASITLPSLLHVEKGRSSRARSANVSRSELGRQVAVNFAGDGA